MNVYVGSAGFSTGGGSHFGPMWAILIILQLDLGLHIWELQDWQITIVLKITIAFKSIAKQVYWSIKVV